MLLVVLAHAVQVFAFAPYTLPEVQPSDIEMGDGYRFIQSFVLYGMVVGLVPVFFMISGYLQFLKERSYWCEVGKKTKGLLLPMLVWTALAIVAYWCLKPWLGECLSFAFTKSKNPWDWVTAVFGSYKNVLTAGAGVPLLYQCWFIRDLFLLTLFFPVIRWLLRRIPIPFLIVCAVVWIGEFHPMVAGEALFFYSVGALCGMKKFDFFEAIDRTCPWWFVIAACIVSVSVMYVKLDYLQVTNNALVYIPTILLLIKLSGLFCKRAKVYGFLEKMSSQSMFLYCAHGNYLIVVLLVFAMRLFDVGTLGGLILGVLFIVVLDVVLCSAAGMLLERFAPRTFSLLTGGRSKK